jgi:hypothetical protein
MRIGISLHRLKALLVTVCAFLVAAGFVVQYADYVWKSESDLIGYFSLSEEQNFPTWWSSYLLLSSAVVLWTIAALKGAAAGEYKKHWTALAAIFCYMSIDEMAEVHELLPSMPGLNNLHGIWYYGWVAPAVVLVTLFGLSYIKFLFHLPPKTRVKVALAGVIYVGGALGVEFILGAYADKHGNMNFTWNMIDLVEESMEIVGASLFLYALMEYLGGIAPDLTIAVGDGDGRATKGP